MTTLTTFANAFARYDYDFELDAPKEVQPQGLISKLVPVVYSVLAVGLTVFALLQSRKTEHRA